jgi:hypothetical protein
MLSEAALGLIREVFGRPRLFVTAQRINRRVVQWGRNTGATALDHAAVVVSEAELVSELGGELEVAEELAGGEADFTIYASRPLPKETVEHCFGSRIASTAQVRLRDAADSATCWIESLEEGWLFLIPTEGDAAWLLAVGCSLRALPERSLIAGRIASMSDTAGQFPASPRILSPLAGLSQKGGPGWLACGTAGMAFDPICGDGTAHAVREAILAAAVVRAMAEGGDAKALLCHYEARLTAGFQRHLAASLAFYQAGNGGPWWEQEIDLLRQGLQWCAGKRSGYGEFRYQLRGFELSSIDNRPS